MSDLERYRMMRARSLRRMAVIRGMNGAPDVVRRREQLFLWAIRRWHAAGWATMPVEDLPGFKRNRDKFLRIYDPWEGRA